MSEQLGNSKPLPLFIEDESYIAENNTVEKLSDLNSFEEEEDAACKGADEAYEEIETKTAERVNLNIETAEFEELIFFDIFTNEENNEKESGQENREHKIENVEPVKTRELTPDERKILQMQYLLAARLQSIGLRGEDNIQLLLRDMKKEMSSLDKTGRLTAKEGDEFNPPQLGKSTRKALELYCDWLKEHGIPGALHQLTAEGLPIPPNQLVKLPIDADRARPVSVATFLTKAYAKEIKPQLDIAGDIKADDKNFDRLMDNLNEADNFIVDSAKLIRKASIDFADQKMMEMVKKGNWPDGWLVQRERAPDKEAWIGAVSHAIDLSMRTGRTVEALHYLMQKPNNAEILPGALAEAEEFADIKYSSDRKKIISIKFKLPQELDLANTDKSEVFQRMENWLKKYGGEIASTLDRVEMANKDPRYQIYWGDIEVSNGKVEFDDKGVVKNVGIGDGAQGKHFNLISCRFQVNEGRNSNSGDLEKISLDYSLQYGEVPVWAYLNCYMNNVGQPQVPNEGKGLEYEPGDWVVIRTSSGSTEFMKAEDLQNWKTMQQIKHYGSKAITATMDIAMLASGGGTALSALRHLATAGGKRLLAKGLFEAGIGGLGIINNAGARENQSLHNLETARGYYFLGHIGYSNILRPAGRLLAGASGATKFESFAQTALKESNLLTRGMAKGGQLGFKAIDKPFCALLVHDMIEQGELLRNADIMNFANDALSSTDKVIREKLLSGEAPSKLEVDKKNRDYKTMSREFLSEYAESLGIKDVFSGADISKLPDKKSDIALLLKEAETMLDKPHEERLKFIREKLIPIFQPSAEEIHDAELKRAEGPISYDKLKDKRVIVPDTTRQENESKEAKSALDKSKQELEDLLQKELQNPSESKLLEQAQKELKSKLEKLSELEQESRTKSFLFDRAITRKDAATASIKSSSEISNSEKQTRKAAAMIAILLAANTDGTLPENGILGSREVLVEGWSVEKVIAHGEHGEPITATIKLNDRNLSQELKASDMIKLLKEDLKAEGNSVEKRLSVGEFLTRVGAISPEQYAATLLTAFDASDSSRSQKIDCIARLAVVMVSLRDQEMHQAGSMSQVDLQNAKGKAMGYSSLEIQARLHNLSRDIGVDKEVRAFASYINYMCERNPALISADDTTLMLARLEKNKTGLNYEDFIKEMKETAFKKEPRSAEEWDEKYHALVALESFLDDKNISLSQEELLVELATCVTPANRQISLLALARLMQPIEGSDSNLTRLNHIDRMDAEKVKFNQDHAFIGSQIRKNALDCLTKPTTTRADALSKASIVALLHPLNMGESRRTLGTEAHKALMETLKPFRQRSIEMARLLLLDKNSGTARALEPASKQLNKEAFEKYPELRIAAAHILGKFQDDSAESIRLLGASADIAMESNPHVRLEAFRALMTIQSFSQLNSLAKDLLKRETNPMMASELEQFARFFERGWNPESFTYQSLEEESRNKEALKGLLPDAKTAAFPDWILPGTLARDLKDAKFNVFKRNEPSTFLGIETEYIGWAPGSNVFIKQEKWRKEEKKLDEVYDAYNKRFYGVIERAVEKKSKADQELLALVLLKSRPIADNFEDIKKAGISPHSINISQDLLDKQQIKAAEAFTAILKIGSGNDRARAAAIVMEAIKSPSCCAKARLVLIDSLTNNSERSFDLRVPLNKSIDQLTAKEKIDLQLGRITAEGNGGDAKLFSTIDLGAAGTQALLDMIDQPFFKLDNKHPDWLTNNRTFIKAMEFIRKHGDTELLPHRKVELFPRLEGKAKSEHIESAWVNHATRQLVADKRDRITPIFDLVKANIDETTVELRLKHLDLALAWSGKEAEKGSDAIEFAARSAVERTFKACKDLPFENEQDPRLESLRELTERHTEKSGDRDDRVRLAAAMMLKNSPLKSDRDLAAGIITELAVGGGVLFDTREPVLQNVRYGVRYDANKLMKQLAPEQTPAIQNKLEELTGSLLSLHSDSSEINRKRDILLANCNSKLAKIFMDQNKPDIAKAKLEKAFALYWNKESYDLDNSPSLIANADRIKEGEVRLRASEHIFDIAETFYTASRFFASVNNTERENQYNRVSSWYIQSQLDPLRLDRAESRLSAAESRARTPLDDWRIDDTIDVFGRAQIEYESFEGKKSANVAHCQERCGDLSLLRSNLEQGIKTHRTPARSLEDARFYFNNALSNRKERRGEEPMPYAEVHAKLGEVAFNMLAKKASADETKDLNAMQEHYNEAIRVAIETGKPEKAAQWSIALARSYQKLSNAEQSETTLARTEALLKKCEPSIEASFIRLDAAKLYLDLGKNEKCLEHVEQVMEKSTTGSQNNLALLHKACAFKADALIKLGNSTADAKYYASAAEPLRQLIDSQLKARDGKLNSAIEKNIQLHQNCSQHALNRYLEKGAFKEARHAISELIRLDRIKELNLSGKNEISDSAKVYLNKCAVESAKVLIDLFKKNSLEQGNDALDLYLTAHKLLNGGKQPNQVRMDIQNMMNRIDSILLEERPGIDDSDKSRGEQIPSTRLLELRKFRLRLAMENVEQGPADELKNDFSTPLSRMSDFIYASRELAEDYLASDKSQESRKVLAAAAEFHSRTLPEELVSPTIINGMIRTYNPDTHQEKIQQEIADYMEKLLAKDLDAATLEMELSELLRVPSFGFGRADSEMPSKTYDIAAEQVVESLIKHANLLTSDNKAKFLSTIGPRLADSLAMQKDLRVSFSDSVLENEFGDQNKGLLNKNLGETLIKLSSRIEKPLYDTLRSGDNKQSGFHDPGGDLFNSYLRQSKFDEAIKLSLALLAKETNDMSASTSIFTQAVPALCAVGRYEDAVMLTDRFCNLNLETKNVTGSDKSLEAYAILSAALERCNASNSDNEKQYLDKLQKSIAEKALPLLEKRIESTKDLDTHDCAQLIKYYSITDQEQKAGEFTNKIVSGLVSTDLHHSVYMLETICRSLAQQPNLRNLLPDFLKKISDASVAIKQEQERDSFKNAYGQMLESTIYSLKNSERKEDATIIMKLEALKTTQPEMSSR